MAPEVANSSRYTTKADVFSFAMVMCEMVIVGGKITELLPVSGQHSTRKRK